jgi:hypothetical protein
MRNDEMRTLIKQLQDRLKSLDDLEERRKERSKRIVEEFRVSKAPVRLESEGDEFRRRTERNLAEITEKLNRLIGGSEHR